MPELLPPARPAGCQVCQFAPVLQVIPASVPPWQQPRCGPGHPHRRASRTYLVVPFFDLGTDRAGAVAGNGELSGEAVGAVAGNGKVTGKVAGGAAGQVARIGVGTRTRKSAVSSEARVYDDGACRWLPATAWRSAPSTPSSWTSSAHGLLLTGTPSVFLPPDAENPLKADYNGDWEAETENLARRGIYVFDQLAPSAATLLERSHALRRLYSDRYPLVIVDEFQDTNLDQWRVIQALAQSSTIICLADPDQRIYEGFVKGVDDRRLQQAVDALEPQRFDLADDNYRSVGHGILDYANAVLRGQPAPLPESVHDLRYSIPPRRNRSPTRSSCCCRPSSRASSAGSPPSPSWPRPAPSPGPFPRRSPRTSRVPGGIRCQLSTTSSSGIPAWRPPRDLSSLASWNGPLWPGPRRSKGR